MNTRDALSYFESLEVVSIEFMIGTWRGTSFDTGHHWDGLLEKYHWHGKQFVDANNVHPLIFKNVFGRLVAVNPVFVPLPLLRFKIFHSFFFGKVFQISIFIFATHKSSARLRMIEYKGKISAAMIYDRQPIIDYFRKIDDNKVLGMMDYKEMPQPYFFILERE